MRQVIKELKLKLKSWRTYLPALVLPHALRREIVAAKRWARGYPAHVTALVLIVVIFLFGWFFMSKEWDQVKRLRLQVSAQSKYYEEKLERKTQRLATALSYLEGNPVLKAPGNKQSLIGPYAKMEWKYSTKDISGSQYSPKHSIVEIRSAETPLERQRLLVTGEAAWYPITLSEKVKKSGTFLWRVIEGEMDPSRNQRAEGSWGPYSVFTIYPSVYERIQKTKKIIIGSYNVAQAKLGNKDSTTEEPCVEPSDGLSDNDTKVLCSVIKSKSIKDKFGELKPIVKRYSNIDQKVIRSLKAGELDIAFGDISNAAYRRKMGIDFVEYSSAEPVLLTNDENKAHQEEIKLEENICAVQGTVYEHVLGELAKNKPGRYSFEVCQNTFDAIDKLLKNDIQWFLMMGTQTWEEIKKSTDNQLYRNTTSKPELVNSVPEENQIGGDAFAMIDKTLYKAICEAIRAIQEEQQLQHIRCLPRLN